MSHTPKYIKGDYLQICQVCGFVMRSSHSRRRWDGLLVCDADYEERHPQDFVRGQIDRQRVPEPSPEPTSILVGPLTTVTTADASAGATTLTVDSSARFAASDIVGVTLSDGNVHRATVSSVPIATQIVLTAGTKLPNSVRSGAMIVNYSAVSTPSY